MSGKSRFEISPTSGIGIFWKESGAGAFSAGATKGRGAIGFSPGSGWR